MNGRAHGRGFVDFTGVASALKSLQEAGYAGLVGTVDHLKFQPYLDGLATFAAQPITSAF